MDIPPVLARREIRSTRFFTLVEEDLPDRHGQPYTYHQVESKWDAVIVIPVLDDGRLVLERIYRHPYRAWVTEFPAGGIEPGEDPCAAAARELEEETGYRAARCTHLHAIEAMPGLLRMRLHVVLAEGLTPGGIQALEALEMLEVEVLTKDEAWARTRAGPASMFLTLGLLALDGRRP
jgi:ADP-ribose pyrophosphatase